ncbi:MAG: hypothetical protein M3137_20230 [Actinomycetota bacterium]|nr:hypothetical protein [Actinomycetota bacterium]
MRFFPTQNGCVSEIAGPNASHLPAAWSAGRRARRATGSQLAGQTGGRCRAELAFDVLGYDG